LAKMDSSLVRIIGNTAKEGKGENQFAQPRGICVDAKTKEIFIVDCNNHRIQVYHLTSLAYIRQIGKGVQGDQPEMLNYAVGICMDDSNQIFVADTNNHRVVVFNRITGGHVRNISSQGAAPGCLQSPYGVCVDVYSNTLYIADYDNHRVQSFHKETGELIRVIGSGYGSGDGQMNQPIVVCVDYELDHLLVADYSNNRVIVFDKETYAFIRNVGTNAGANSLSGPRGLCLNKEANILCVSDRENHRIQLYDKSTYQYLRTIGDGPGTNPGQFHRPMEICVNVEEGVLLVVDGYNHRVQVLEIPELQPEKRRLRALAKAKAEAELRGKALPKPSILAVSTNITGQEMLVRDVSGVWRLRFPHLGPLFDVPLSADELSMLVAQFSGTPMVERVGCELQAGLPESGTVVAAAGPGAPCVAALKKQAGMFLSILESLCADDADGDGGPALPYMFAAPALFALHSLIERGWQPDFLSVKVVNLLANFLSNVGDGIASESERVKVHDALTALLRAGIAAQADVRDAVLQAVLQCLDGDGGVGGHRLADTVLAAVTDTEGSQGTTSKADAQAIMLSYLDLLGEVFAHEGGAHEQYNAQATKPLSNSVTRCSSRVSLAAPTTAASAGRGVAVDAVGTAPTTMGHERRKLRNQLRDDAVEFSLGTQFVRALSGQTAPLRDGAQAQKGMAAPTAAAVCATGTSPASGDPKQQPTCCVPTGLTRFVKTAFAVHRLRSAEASTSLLDAPGPDGQVCDQTLHALQVDLFRSAAEYMHELRLHESGGKSHASSSTSRRSRGGRNIWRPHESLAPGDLVDAQDKEKCWFESIVQDITPEGGVKVHFMGWGSKWDDVLNPAELPARLAPLNTKTKNWRADLFTGGLIEIKCNDDPVNQKWMWGKITALNVEEAWVEVSYLFSNEPSVVKRAWLFGETICPVGMHTKDKSKAAAATLVKPLKKVRLRVNGELKVYCNRSYFIEHVVCFS
jgi:hypothetical protein